jgi:hypothetical protein
VRTILENINRVVPLEFNIFTLEVLALYELEQTDIADIEN